MLRDLTDKTGRDERHLPRVLRGEGQGMTHVNSIVTAYGDMWVHPDSGGVIGQGMIAETACITQRTARRTLLREPWVRWVGAPGTPQGLPATHVDSIAAWRQAHYAAISETRQAAVHRRWTMYRGS